MRSAFLHLQGHLYCSIDTETTGTIAGHHDLVQVAIIPLGYDLKPASDKLPFLMDLQPKRRENVDWEAMRINKLQLCDIIINGVEPYRGADLFVEWFHKLNLFYQKRITPIGANYVFDRDFLIEWLGPATYNLCFNSDFRDVLSIARYRNDRDCWNARDPVSHDRATLAGLCLDFKIERTKSHDATDDARVTAEVYRRLVQEFM